jgi:hypothetical protein
MGIGTEVMLGYLQSWGQSAEKKIATLNKAAAAAGLHAEWRQEPDGAKAGWYGPDCERAAEFKRRLNDVWCGDFNVEARNVETLIAEFARTK